MVVFGQSNDPTARSDFESAATRHFNFGRGKLRQQRHVRPENGHVELISMRVADEDIAGVRNFDAVRVRRHRLVANRLEDVAAIVDHDHAVSLKVADVVIAVPLGDVGRLLHESRAIDIVEFVLEIGTVDAVRLGRRDKEDGRLDAVHDYDASVGRNGETGDDVHKRDIDAAKEMPGGPREDLHSGPDGSAIANDERLRVLVEDDLSREVQLAVVFALFADSAKEASRDVEHLKSEKRFNAISP